MSSKVSNPNDENVGQLCAILDINPLIAGNLLEACNNNLQMAVQMHYDSGNQTTTVNGYDDDNVRPPIPPRQEVLVENPLEMGFAFRGRQRPSHISAFDKFRDFAEETREVEETGSRRRNVAGPSRRNSQLEKKLERLYRPPFDIMFTGSFQSARDAGSSSFKWLMVNIQNSSEFACQVLNRDVWSDSKVRDMISEHFIFWQVYHDSQPGTHYMNLYPVDNWPYVSIIDPRTGECLVTWNKLDSTNFCDLANVFLSRYNTLEDADKSDGQTQPRKKKKITTNILDADEESQLKAAIQASLSENEKTSEEEGQTRNHSEEDIFEMTDSDCEEIDASFEDTPMTNGIAETEDKTEQPKRWNDYLGLDTDPQCQIRLFAEGCREIVSMPVTSKLKALVLYAEEKGFPSHQYTLETHFPKKSLSAMDPLSTLLEAGLSLRETVYISRS